MNKIVIGTRSSQLALWQSNYIKDELNRLYPGIEVELKHVKTKGDKILDTALSKIGDKGLFTKELEIELLNGTVDIAVHSLKDLQTEIPEGLELAAVTKRHDPRDVLVAREKGFTIDDMKQNGTMATGSLRRKSQLLISRPDLNIVDLRGNVNTRLQKFLDSDWEGIVLAAAGLERINLQEYISSYIPFDKMLPAVGQGALGVEISEANTKIREILKPLNHKETYLAAICERSFLTALGGGCQTPIAAHAEVKNDTIEIDGLVASLDGTVSYRKTISDDMNKAVEAGKKLAGILINDGAGDILNNL